MKTPHYFCESCQLSIPIILKEVHENTEYHKTRLEKSVKQGIIKFDIKQIEEILSISSTY